MHGSKVWIVMNNDDSNDLIPHDCRSCIVCGCMDWGGFKVKIDRNDLV